MRPAGTFDGRTTSDNAPMRKSQNLVSRAGAPRWPGLPPGEDPFRQLVESVQGYALCLLDRDGRIRSWNAGAERIHGYGAGEIVGLPFAVLFTPAEMEVGRPQELLERAAEHGRSEDEGWRARRDGSGFWGSLALTALRDADGELYGYGLIARDLSEKREKDEELRRTHDRTQRLWRAAISDALTGAYNRRYMENHLRGAIDRGEHPVSSLLMFDVDHFKAVNDQFGHDAGDLVLKRIAEVARQILRDSDMLFRLGGDEFLLYLPDVAAAGAAAIARRLRDAVASSGAPGSKVVTISIGVAQRAPADSLEDWIRKADVALYEAKQGGRNRIA
jgi:diguanylate cyclase (GGDEF)-like protein/PAS domain S-box-containing protein